MGRNRRELSSQRESAVTYKEAISGQPLQVNSRCRAAERGWLRHAGTLGEAWVLRGELWGGSSLCHSWLGTG